jgi:hypothetical protein
MAEYRAYIIGVDGHFVGAVEFICPDDDTAKEYAKQLVDGRAVAGRPPHSEVRWQTGVGPPQFLRRSGETIPLVSSRT